MTPISEEREPYSQQLCRYARALAAAQYQPVIADLARGFTPDQLKMFVDGNLDKRLQKLTGQLDFVADAFEDFEALLREYSHAIPLAAYDTGASDGKRFLEWLAECRKLTPEQLDYVACQCARLAVEDCARTHRLEHVHFQEMWRMADQLSQELDSNPTLRIHLNPIRAETQFQTQALLDDATCLPARVLFYPSGTTIRTAVLEYAGTTRIEQLARIGPCTLDEWLDDATSADSLFRTDDDTPASREELIAFCRELGDMGLLAFG